jgi:hypothetical protein
MDILLPSVHPSPPPRTHRLHAAFGTTGRRAEDPDRDRHEGRLLIRSRGGERRGFWGEIMMASRVTPCCRTRSQSSACFLVVVARSLADIHIVRADEHVLEPLTSAGGNGRWNVPGQPAAERVAVAFRAHRRSSSRHAARSACASLRNAIVTERLGASRLRSLTLAAARP